MSKHSETILSERISTLSAHALTESTRRGYRRDWSAFKLWCSDHDAAFLPAPSEVVSRYVASQSERLSSVTLRRHLAAISWAHRKAGEVPATSLRREPLRSLFQGLCRLENRRTRQARPLASSEIKLVLSHASVPEGMPEFLRLRTFRDRALLLIGYAGALRRSELARLRKDDISFDSQGVILRLVGGKTTGPGGSRLVAIAMGAHSATCPVGALQEWLAHSRIEDGHVFRGVLPSGRFSDSIDTSSINRIVKRRLSAAGIDPSAYSAHSLRAGMATEAARRGATERDIARITGHRSIQVLRGYIRDGHVWHDNASARLGL
jgi:integrase